MSQTILSVRDLEVHFPVRGGGLRAKTRYLKAVDGISFDIATGETLGVVGESGCGKSTLGRAILQLIMPTAGRVTWLGRDITGLDDRSMRSRRAEMQIIFQDPLASLDPRMTIGDIIAEPLRIFQPELGSEEIAARVKQLMAQVGLLPRMINRYPHEFSGGQCQRIGIARAIILNPKLIVCDEPVSALDVSIQGQIINLLMELQRAMDLALIFISHDLSVVRHISHRVLVLYLGNVVELAEREALYRQPRHPYTRALVSAVPLPDPDAESRKERLILKGDLPSPLVPPSGCVFRTRCPLADERCAREVPVFERVTPDHELACHHWRRQE
jgi:oligopeptide transport system ATP-binding protein